MLDTCTVPAVVHYVRSRYDCTLFLVCFYFFGSIATDLDCSWFLSPWYLFSPIVSAVMQFAGLIQFWERVISRKQGLPKQPCCCKMLP